ncbi:MAG: BMP family ABC transporter substrate-binding protein [Oscillospiraceae bacterium]|nr:BMP family ABC transporter substrate-binding protein [Oscillospiraceae bacterium]
MIFKTAEAKGYIKKLTSILLAVALIMLVTISFTACDDEENNGTTTDEGSEDNGTDLSNEDEQPAELTPQRVGFIYSGQIEGSSHNKMWEDARANLEMQLDADTFYVENVFISNFAEAVDLLVTYGVDVIISTSHFFANAVEIESVNHRNIVFISFGGETVSPNLIAFVSHLYQPAHVAGFAAAHNTAVGVDSMGIILDSRMHNAHGVVNSFIQGAKFNFLAGVTIHVRLVNSRSVEEVRQAVDQLIAEGNDTIFAYIDTEYAITYAEQRGVNVVGFANNVPQLAPNNHIAGLYFNVNSYLVEQVRIIQNETFVPSVTRGALSTGHVRLSAINADPMVVEPETHDLAGLIHERVSEGTAAIFAGEIMDNHGEVQVPNGVTLTSREILDLNWFEHSIGGNIHNLTVPIANLPIVPLIIAR